MSTKVTLYVTSHCPYCNYAKRFLDANSIEFETVDVTRDTEKRMWLVEATGKRTVPQIFVGDTVVGGYTDMQDLHKRGEFQPLLEQNGVSHGFN